LAVSEAQASELSGKNSSGVQIVPCRLDEKGGIDLSDMLEKLYAAGVHSVFVEGGARIISSFLDKNLAQRFYQFIAPLIIGSKGGLSYSSEYAVPALPDRRELRHPRTVSFGRDMMVTGRLD